MKLPPLRKIRVLAESENTIVLSDELGVCMAHCSKKGKSLRDIQLCLDNSEFDWGHNVKHTNNEEI